MSRNQAGNYTLPLPPVVPGDVIESQWANATTSDLAEGLTQSLDRSGRGAMLAPLILSSDPITQSLQAVSKEYVDQFLAYATGMPIGAVTAYATNSVPGGWLLCNGNQYRRVDYPALFATIGTIYGSGDGSGTTFNVPDLRNEFIRGQQGTATLGTHYPSLFKEHSHGVGIASNQASADHTHAFTTGGVSANATHNHNISDPGHAHGVNTLTSGTGTATGSGVAQTAPTNTTSSQTGIGIVGANTDHTHSGNTGGTSVSHFHDVVGNTASTGGADTLPQHMVMHYIIKAVEDATESASPVGALTRGSSSSIPSGASTRVVFESLQFNSGLTYTESARFTVPSTGMYQVNGSIRYAAGGAGERSISIRRNGTDVVASATMGAANTTDVWQPQTSVLLQLAAGDYIELFAFQGSGSDISLGTSAIANFLAVSRIK